MRETIECCSGCYGMENGANGDCLKAQHLNELRVAVGIHVGKNDWRWGGRNHGPSYLPIQFQGFCWVVPSQLEVTWPESRLDQLQAA